MYTYPTEPTGIGQVLDKAFQLTKASFSKVWWVALLSAITSSAGDIYASTVQAGTTQAMLFKDGTWWTVTFCGALVSIVFAGMMYLRQHAVATGQPGGGEFGTALRKLPITFVGGIFFILAVLAGTVLLVVPGVLLLVSLFLFQLMVLLEDKGPVSALTASHKLVWGNWWRTLGAVLLGGVIAIVIYFMVAFLAGTMIAVLVGIGAGTGAMMAALISVAIVVLAVALLVGPFFAALVISVYYDLKLRRQGGDLAARVGALAT